MISSELDVDRSVFINLFFKDMLKFSEKPNIILICWSSHNIHGHFAKCQSKASSSVLNQRIRGDHPEKKVDVLMVPIDQLTPWPLFEHF